MDDIIKAKPCLQNGPSSEKICPRALRQQNQAYHCHYRFPAVARGMSRRISTYVDDDQKSTDTYEWPPLHQNDINAIINLPPNMAASASSDGDIVIWSLTTGV